MRKRILITGSGSYIGMSLDEWLCDRRFGGSYQVETLDMKTPEWRGKSFSGYDTVFHVAGIAHADTRKVSGEQRNLYYTVNCELAVEAAKKAKDSGVRQFIYMSSIIVYGDTRSIRNKQIITERTRPHPDNYYGDSKWKAEQKLMRLRDRQFQIAILRPPMIYGRGSRGNYPLLSRIARTFPLFPDIDNRRSMLYIGNFCEFARLLIEEGEGGIFFPQNREYAKTTDIIEMIAEIHGRKLRTVKCLNWLIYLMSCVPGSVGGKVRKAFGTKCYDLSMSDTQMNYRIYSFKESVILSEK